MKFFFCDGLTWDDVFDWHDLLILPLSRLPERGEANTPPETKVALLWKINNLITHQARLTEWTITTAITQQAPFPFILSDRFLGAQTKEGRAGG